MSKILLVLGSLTFFFIVLEGSSTLLLKNRGPRFRDEPPPAADEIWNIENVRFHSSQNTRTGEIARIIIAGNYKERFPYFKLSKEEMGQKWEPADYTISKQGNTLSRGNFIVTPNLNDDFFTVGLHTRRPKFQAHYTTDDTGMRKGYAGKNHNILFVGCSFTFGYGLNDEETFPYMVGKKTGYRTFNKGIAAAGPLTILQNLRELKKQYFKNIPPETTTVILTVIPELFHRVINTTSYLRMRNAMNSDHPYLVVRDNQLIIKTLNADDPYRIKRPELLLARLNFPTALGIEYPIIGDDDYRLFVRVILEIQTEMKKNFPQVKNFVVALYPTGTMRRLYRELSEALLQEKNLTVFDYSRLQGQMLFGDAFQLKFDGHPSREANELYSDLLIYDLKKSFGI